MGGNMNHLRYPHDPRASRPRDPEPPGLATIAAGIAVILGAVLLAYLTNGA